MKFDIAVYRMSSNPAHNRRTHKISKGTFVIKSQISFISRFDDKSAHVF